MNFLTYYNLIEKSFKNRKMIKIPRIAIFGSEKQESFDLKKLLPIRHYSQRILVNIEELLITIEEEKESFDGILIFSENFETKQLVQLVSSIKEIPTLSLIPIITVSNIKLNHKSLELLYTSGIDFVHHNAMTPSDLFWTILRFKRTSDFQSNSKIDSIHYSINEHPLRQGFDSVPQPVLLFNSNFKSTYCNSSAINFFSTTSSSNIDNEFLNEINSIFEFSLKDHYLSLIHI